jgi:hypothetical protein
VDVNVLRDIANETSRKKACDATNLEKTNLLPKKKEQGGEALL